MHNYLQMHAGLSGGAMGGMTEGSQSGATTAGAPALPQWRAALLWFGLAVACGCSAAAAGSGLDATTDQSSAGQELARDEANSTIVSADSGRAAEAVAEVAADAMDPCKSATPVTCFVGAPPSPTECVAPSVLPTAICPELEVPAWYEGVAVPKPTLDVQLGRYDAKGTFWPLHDGDWLPLLTAAQGGFHFGLVPRFVVPAKSGAKAKLQFDAFAAHGCAVVANKLAAAKWFTQGQAPGQYTVEQGHEVLTVFVDGIAKKTQYCGLWYRVVFRVRVPGTDQWGQHSVLVRSYDGTAKAVKVHW